MVDLPPVIPTPTEFPAYIELHRDVLINADIWTATPQILAANWGFEGIMGIPGLASAADLGRAVLVGAGTNRDFANLSPTPPLRNLTSGGSALGLIAGGFGAVLNRADAFPIEFSWPLLPSTVSPTDFAIHLSDGSVVTPQAAALNPNYDYNERHVVVMMGEFGNRLLPGTPGAIYPVSVEIVADSTPLQLVGPNGPTSAVGLTKTGVNPFLEGPGLVGAKVTRFSSVGDFAPPSLSSNSPNDGASLYGSQAAYRLRLYTWGGFSPDGVSPILPTEFAKYFKLQAKDANGQTVTITQTGQSYDLGGGIGSLTVVGLAELGKVADGTTVVYTTPYYTEDHDNYVDIILTGDEAAIRRLVSVSIPTSAEAGYSDLYNPGGPGRTPATGVTYTAAAKPQTFVIDVALDASGTVSHAAQSVASYDSADGLPIVFRLRHPTLFDTVYTASSKTAAALMVQGYVEQGVSFSNEQNSQNLVSVREFHSATTSDHIYTADAAEIARLSQADSGYTDQGVVFSAISTTTEGAAPIYRFYSSALGEHIYTPSLTEGFTSEGYAYQGIGWYSAALMTGLTSDVLFNRGDDVTFADTLSGTGGLTKRGAGTLTLTGSNTMSGATSVEAGTLRVDGSLFNSAITLASGATLAGTGTVGSVIARGEVAPGPNVGTLSAAGTVTFMTGSRLTADITPTAAAKLAVQSSASILGGTLRINVGEGTYTTGTTYDLITTTAGLSGAFSNLYVANPERLGGLVASVNNTATNLKLTLGGAAALTTGADIVSYVSQSLPSGLSGLGSDDQVTFLGTGNQVGGDIGGGGQLVVGGGTTSKLALSAGTQNFTTVTNQSDGTLTVNSQLQAGTLLNAGTLGGGGTIVGTVVNAGTLAPGNSPGVLAVTGSVTEATTSTLSIEIDGATAGTGDGFHDQVNVTGTPGTYAAAGTLVPVLRGFTEADASPYTPSLGQQFTIVTASGGVSGSFSALTQPSTGLPSGARFDALYGANAITLVVTPSRYANLDGLTANQRATAAAFDAARPASGTRTGTDADTLSASLYALNANQTGAVMDQLSGAIHADSLAATLGVTRLFGDTLANRAAALRRGGLETSMRPMTSLSMDAASHGATAATSLSGGVSGGSEGAVLGLGRASVWARGLGQFTHGDSDGNAAGAKTNTGGAAFGMDGRVSPELVVGLGLGYFKTHQENDAGLGKTEIGGYAIGAYGAYQSGGWFADAVASYTFSDYDSRRAIQYTGIDRTATGQTQGHAFGGALTVGHSLAFAGGVIEPAATIRYDHISRQSFTENGAGSLGLGVEDRAHQGLRSGLGARAVWSFGTAEALLEPELRARWDHDFLDTAATSRATLGGQGFRVASADLGRDAAVLGAGISARIGDRLEAVAGYDAEIRAGQRSHTVTAALRYRLP